MTAAQADRRAAPALADRLLGWAGIDAIAFRALTKAYALMDFRSQQFGRVTRSGHKALITPLFWVLGQNLLIGIFAACGLFARVDVFFFSVVTLGAMMVVVVTSIIVEFNEVVLDPEDLRIVGHLPVPLRTYAAARVFNLLGFVLLMGFTVALVPAIIGTGLADAGWAFLPAYAAAALLGTLVAAGGTILFYVAFGSRPTPAAQEVLAWSQAVLMGVVFYGGQLILRNSSHEIPWMAYRPPPWLAYLPPTWLAWMVDDMAVGADAPRWWIGVAAAAAAVFVWVLVIWRLSIAYAPLQPGKAAWQRTTLRALRVPGELAHGLMRLVTRRHEERSAFWLCSTMLRRDINLRMRCWPLLGTVVAAVAMGLFTRQLADPFVFADHNCVLSLAAVYLLAMPIPSILYNLRFSKDHEASWLMKSAPVADRAAFARGMLKSVAAGIMLPMLMGVFVVFWLTWRDPAHAALQTLVGALVIVAAGDTCALVLLRHWPLSKPLARGESFGPIAPLAAAVSGVAMLLGVVQYAALQRPMGFVVFLAALIILVVGFHFVAWRWLAVRLTPQVSR